MFQRKAKKDPEVIYYFDKSQLDREVGGYNLLFILEQLFPKSNKDFLIVSFRKHINIPNVPYAGLIQMFLQHIANSGHTMLLINYK